MREWQPIETAPKDGTVILVCDPENESWPCSVVRWRAPEGPYGYEGWEDSDGGFYDATHWQPLPDPPQ